MISLINSCKYTNVNYNAGEIYYTLLIEVTTFNVSLLPEKIFKCTSGIVNKWAQCCSTDVQS